MYLPFLGVKLTNFEVNHRENRNQNNIFVERINLNRSENMLDFASCTVYNGLPDDIKAIRNINTFKLKLKARQRL